MSTQFHENDTDGRTLWVNGSVSCLGRVTPTCVEVVLDSHVITLPFGHPSQIETIWAKFQLLMLTHHGVVVPDEAMPDSLKRTTS